MSRIEVAVGVIRRGDKLLVGQRLVKDLYYQKWEFPGGKLEQGESAKSALKRELFEELAIDVELCKPLIQLDHDYVDRQVRLHVFEVLSFKGEPQGKEGQAIKWVLHNECLSLDFLEANQPIVNATVLPQTVLITDIQHYGLSKTLERVSTIQGSMGPIQLHLRERDADKRLLKDYIQKIKPLLLPESLLVLNGDPEMAIALECDGVHLNVAHSKLFSKRSQLDIKWVGTSCHNADELNHAQSIADFAFLSPVKVTSSHPEAVPLGLSKFQLLSEKAVLPLYALGGMSLADKELAKDNGAQGVAVLSAAWE